MSQQSWTAVHIVGGSAQHTTGRHFVPSVRATGVAAYYHADPSRLPRLAPTDLVLFVEPFAAGWPSGMERLPCPVVAYLIDVHQGVQHRFPYLPFFDTVFVAQRDYCDVVAAQCTVPVEWLPLACAPALLPDSVQRSLEVGFVGQLGAVGTTRRMILEAVLREWQSNDYLAYYSPSEMMAAYASAKVVINHSVNGDLNMRVFEAMCAGALVVTDRIGNGLSDLFEEDRHYVAYGTLEEAVDKITYYLAHDDARAPIVQAGMALARQRHTYDQRWAQIANAASRLVPPYPAAIRHLKRPQRARAYAAVYESQRRPLAVLGLLARSGSANAVPLCASLLRAFARRVNYHVPITAGARRARLGPR